VGAAPVTGEIDGQDPVARAPEPGLEQLPAPRAVAHPMNENDVVGHFTAGLSIISPLASIFDHFTAAARASTALTSLFDHFTAAARASTALTSHYGRRLGSHCHFDHFTARLAGGTASARTAIASWYAPDRDRVRAPATEIS
jgi:hypothetical protein